MGFISVRKEYDVNTQSEDDEDLGLKLTKTSSCYIKKDRVNNILLYTLFY